MPHIPIVHNTLLLYYELLVILIQNLLLGYFAGETQHSPPTNYEVTNPTYNTVIDQSKQPVKEPVGYYAEVIIPTAEVKMTPNPAYAVS